MSEQKTVLLIDDSPALQNLVRAELIDPAVRVESAYDGESGIELAYSLQPDLVLLDVDMPGANGFDVCRQLSGTIRTAGIPIIFLTSAGQAAEKVRGLESGAIDYITKPFDSGEFNARVRSALRSTSQTPRRRQHTIARFESDVPIGIPFN